MSETQRAPDAASAAVYRRVVDALQEWSLDTTIRLPVEHQLVSTLDDALNGGAPRGAKRHTVRAPSAGVADVAVDDTVAVFLFWDFGPGTISAFSGQVSAISATYDYLVVLGYDLPDRDVDRWRMGKARYTAERSDLEGITYLTHTTDEETSTTGWPSTLWYYAEPLVALLAIIVGLEIAVIIQLRSGDPSPLLGPVATGATVLVLMGLLVLVYERTAF